MLANRILDTLLTGLSWVVFPVQLLTTLVFGLLVTMTFGLLLLPISLVWAILIYPMIGASWLSGRTNWLRNTIRLLGIPWAIIANTYVALMPSMGEFESRAARLMITDVWPYSWEFWQFQHGRMKLNDPEMYEAEVILSRLTMKDLLKRQTLDRLSQGEELDADRSS